MLSGHGVVFVQRERAELEPVEFEPRDLGPTEVLVHAEYSIVSAGTEGAFYTDLIATAPAIYHAAPTTYPARTGYGHLGHVIAAGPAVTDVGIGDRILTYSRHASLVRVDTAGFVLPVPATADGQRAVFVRLAGVAITALRASSATAGDRVAVVGLGVVGNLAAQLFQLAGCDVIAFDPVDTRRHVARSCGIANVHDPTDVDPVDVTLGWVGAADDHGGVRIVVDAAGRSDTIALAVELAGEHGEVVLLGSPRAAHVADLTPMLARIHLLAIRMIGALEWTFPIRDDTASARHTVLGNAHQLLEWILTGRLIVDPLLSHVLRPAECQAAYAGLTHRPTEHLGVVFDWTAGVD